MSSFDVEREARSIVDAMTHDDESWGSSDKQHAGAMVLAAFTRCRDAAVRETEEAKNQAYNERNRLVAYLASIYPSCLERHPEEDVEWEDDWRWIVFIHHSTGQLSWHIHDSELGLFDHVPRGFGHVKWDGHTTKEKYERLETAIHERRRRKEQG